MNAVAMVFVTTDEGRVLMSAIESLYATRTRRPLEIVVIDNASSDGAAARMTRRWPEIQILRQPRRSGLPTNLNRGIRATVSPYMMLCNPDLIFQHAAVDVLADFLDSHPGAGIAAPRLMWADGTPRPSARRWYTARHLIALKLPWTQNPPSPAIRDSVYDDWDHRAPRSVDWVPCPATMIRRAALDEVGLMDERFRLYFDDVDLSLRMHEGGWEVWCVPDAKVVHLEQRASVRPLTTQWRWHLVSLTKFWWKHRGLRPRRLPGDRVGARNGAERHS
ncbi:MAG: glycosyltransferase family 2 protein [Actinomycetota bacterium]